MRIGLPATASLLLHCSLASSLRLNLKEFPPNRPDGAPWRVCVVLEEGFSMRKNGGLASDTIISSDAQLKGYDVDVRTSVLDGVNYEVVVWSGYGETQVRTRAGECDIAWAQYFQTLARLYCPTNPDAHCRALDHAPLHATSAPAGSSPWEPYRCCAHFSVNVLSFEMVILSRSRNESFMMSFFHSFANAWFVNFFSFVFVWAAVFAHLVWAAERHRNSEQFPTNYLSGIDDAMWWVLVTFTTVGYGDKVPCTPAGKIVAGVWMILALAQSSILIGRTSSTFDDATARSQRL